MPEISIVVPVYNVEKYLETCIDSILNQTFIDFELILVDDGSKDSSGSICDRYAKQDDRVRVIHKENGGVSSARNMGMQHCKGTYLMFCDSDDYVHPQWCEKLYSIICENPYAAVSCDFQRTAGVTTFDVSIHEDNEVIELDYYTLYKRGSGTSFIWNKIYNLSIIRNHQIEFDESFQISEDVKFNSAYSVYCKTYIHILKALYFYVQRENSAMHSYRPDILWYCLNTFYSRIPLIGEENFGAYCDEGLYTFIHEFDNVFDKRNKRSFFGKMRYNQKMIQSEQFTFCIHHATGKKESPLLISILKKQNYYLYWAFEKLVHIKNGKRKK